LASLTVIYVVLQLKVSTLGHAIAGRGWGITKAPIKTGTARVGLGWAGMAGPLVSDALWKRDLHEFAPFSPDPIRQPTAQHLG
jgi:hypothetical protein